MLMCPTCKGEPEPAGGERTSACVCPPPPWPLRVCDGEAHGPHDCEMGCGTISLITDLDSCRCSCGVMTSPLDALSDQDITPAAREYLRTVLQVPQ